MTRLAVDMASVVGRIDRDETVRLAQALIRIPSVNPPGEEAAVAQYLAEYLEKASLRVEFTEVLPGRPNVVATAEFGDGGPTVLLNGHTDVVAVGDGWDGDPFAGEVREGKLYGRGAADMKGPLAAMIAATLAVKRARVLSAGRIVVACVMGEEYGGLGTRDLVRQGLRADHAIVGEPSELLPVIAHKGTVRFEIEVEGKAAHGSVPEAGVNAIYRIADIVLELRRLHEALTRRRAHPLVGSASLNVGTITGGSGTCIVPARASITIDRRVLPGEPVDGAIQELEAILAERRRCDPELRARLTLQNVAAAMEVAAEEPVVKAIRRSVRAVLARDPGVHGWTATADSNMLVNDLRIPTVIFGPGSIAKVAHQANEYVRVEELNAATEVYVRAMTDLLTESRTEGR
jgi:acetylornithine deacetylase/succinyl-diaminopimelate desuccinylase family protein